MSEYEIVGLGMVNGLGIGPRSVICAVAAGISSFHESSFIGPKGNPIRLAEIPEECLPDISHIPIKNHRQRYSRMLRLALLACEQAIQEAKLNVSVPAFLATPNKRTGGNYPALEPFLKDLDTCLQDSIQRPLDLVGSEVFPNGHAGGYLALQAAMEYIASGSGEMALIGGVDTFIDPLLLQELVTDDRLLLSDSTEGFISGEGATFLVIQKASDVEREIQQVRLGQVGVSFESGHFYSDETCLATGLTESFEIALNALEGKIRTVCSNQNGESKQIKEWGMSSIRHSEKFEESLNILHPADGFGDIGAASAPTLIGLAAMGLLNGYYNGPILTWAASDYGERGSVVVG